MLRSRSSARKRVLPFVALSVVLALFGGCSTPAARNAPEHIRPDAAAAVRIADLGWLIGIWRGRGEGEEFFEHIAVQDDSTFSIVYYTDSTRTATLPITGTVEERAGRVYHTQGTARWVVVEGPPKALVFHPVEGANHRLRWTFEMPTRRTTAVVRTDTLGRDAIQTYSLKRLDVYHDWQP